MNSPKGLGPHQAAALQEFTSAVRELLGSRLMALKLFGSHVRGEFWSDGTYLSTVGQHSSEDEIRRSIAHQGRQGEYSTLHTQQLRLF